MELGLIHGHGMIILPLIQHIPLLGRWEEDWNMMTACYFCFVTISTIGFGDLVPGAAQFGGGSDTWKMVFTAVYMLFGMAILSMCFSLIQEEIVAKFR